jgi:RNA polymerase sigma-70 factor (ECF subfamily)
MEADERLMERVQRGDGRALEILIQRHGQRLHRFLTRRGDAARADDLFQETWLRVVRGRASFDPARRFSSWLFQIANNLCRDLARRRAVEVRELHGLQARAGAAADAGRSGSAELKLDVRRRLGALPERLREVLVLRYFEGMAEAEIASVVGVPAGTVKSRLHAAVKALRLQEVEPDVA